MPFMLQSIATDKHCILESCLCVFLFSGGARVKNEG